MLFTLTGMSEPIDRHFTSRDAGVALAKPKPKLSSLFIKIIDRLNERRPRGWTTAGLHLLSSASLHEQRKLERSLDKLRAMVRRSYRDPAHINSVQIQPPQKRKARVGFFVFHEELRGEYKQTMAQLSAETLDTDDVKACVMFARSTEKWDIPYETVIYARKR